MTTYYEILKLAPNASQAEVVSAIDDQYHRWRRLVTHHSPQVVDEANRALHLLDQIRGSLADPTERAKYDATLNVSGLTDPDSLLKSVGPPMATAPARRPAPAVKPALWACPKCKTENPVETRFCFSCGAQLVRECPECHEMKSLVSTGFCGHCGYSFEVAARRVVLRPQIDTLNREFDNLAKELQTVEADVVEPGPVVLITLVSVAVLVIINLAIIAFGYSTYRGAGFYGLALFACVVLFGLGIRSYRTRTEEKRARVFDLSQRIDEKKKRLLEAQQEYRESETDRSIR